jgi:ferredoxin
MEPTGHLHHLKREYRELAERLDQSPMRFPAPTTERAWQGWKEILEILFSPEQAELAARMPWRPATLAELEVRLGMDRAALLPRLEAMCDRGLVMDLRHPETGRVKYLLAPPLGGFLEFSMMRRGDDIPKKRMAEALEAYCFGDDTFARELFDRPTRFGRAVAHEPALGEEQPEVLDWERASELVRTARSIAVSLCYCRHTAEHLGRRCAAPMDNCLSLGAGADFIARRGFGRRIEVAEALAILESARDARLVHIVDNVQRRPVYLCNCCGCCCEQLQAINRFGLRAVSPSGFLPACEPSPCKGCSRCARNCPIGAISLRARRAEAESRSRLEPLVDAERCIGCAVCVGVCRSGALSMRRRPDVPEVPANGLERVVRMALERGQLGQLLFDQGESRGARFLGEVLSALGQLPVAQQALAHEQLRSRFVRFLLGRRRA